jgi:hypothetical protein
MKYLTILPKKLDIDGRVHSRILNEGTQITCVMNEVQLGTKRLMRNKLSKVK